MEMAFRHHLKDALLMLRKSTVQWAFSEQYNGLGELQRSFLAYIIVFLCSAYSYMHGMEGMCCPMKPILWNYFQI